MKKIDILKKYLRIVMLLLLIIIGIYVVLVILPNKSKNNDDIEEVSKIKYDYVLYKRDSSIYKGIFNELKKELESDNINYDKYAEYVSELFIVDLYTLSNKNNKNDVGGLQFVIDSIKDNYKLNVSNTLYKYVGISKEKPEVNKIELVNLNKIDYIINDKTYTGYEVSLKWEYVKDLGYDKEGKVIVVRDGEKLYVVEKK